MPDTLKLEIVTPEAKTFSGDVSYVKLPAVEGEMMVYPMHVPLATQIGSGEVIVRQGHEDVFLAIGDGFVEITADRMTLLSDMAIKAEDIDEAKAEEARRRAEARLQEHLTDEETATVNAALAHSLTQIQVKRRRRHQLGAPPPGSE